MPATRIYSEDWEIDARLAELCGATRLELVQVVRDVVAAKADAIDLDPRSAPGLLAYIFGTRGIRALFRRKGWSIDRHEGVEATKHPTRDLKIIYQSVDVAASKISDPRAVSGKGSGADRIVESAQGLLFTDEMLAKAAGGYFDKAQSGAWFFCVSVIDDEAYAELSIPSAITGGNFGQFAERIFIVRNGEWGGLRIKDDEASTAVEFEPVVTRK